MDGVPAGDHWGHQDVAGVVDLCDTHLDHHPNSVNCSEFDVILAHVERLYWAIFAAVVVAVAEELFVC